MMKDFFGLPLSVFTIIWNIIDWNSVNIVFTILISVLTIIYLILKILILSKRKGKFYKKQSNEKSKNLILFI